MDSSMGDRKANEIREMFSQIAGRYALANRWMTWGQDLKWRREVLRMAQLPVGGRLLDIGTGTGELPRLALQLDEGLFVVGADFTLQMMNVGQSQEGGKSIAWAGSDAMELPFVAESFDVVVSGYLLRNVGDVEKALAEQYRVLKWGGRMVCLDTTPPPIDFWHCPARLYLEYLIPVIGGSISGDKHAYAYLAHSTRAFLSTAGLARYLERAGFSEVGFRRFMGGAMAIHWGIKKEPATDG